MNMKTCATPAIDPVSPPLSALRAAVSKTDDAVNAFRLPPPRMRPIDVRKGSFRLLGDDDSRGPATCILGGLRSLALISPVASLLYSGDDDPRHQPSSDTGFSSTNDTTRIFFGE